MISSDADVKVNGCIRYYVQYRVFPKAYNIAACHPLHHMTSVLYVKGVCVYPREVLKLEGYLTVLALPDSPYYRDGIPTRYPIAIKDLKDSIQVGQRHNLPIFFRYFRRTLRLMPSLKLAMSFRTALMIDLPKLRQDGSHVE